MGITSINKLLEDKLTKAKIAFKEKLPFHQCFGLKIAIDISILANAHWYICLGQSLPDRIGLDEPDRDAVRKLWIPKILEFITKMIEKGIVPILVFDGEPPELKKQFARKDRENKKTNYYKKLDDLLEELRQKDVLAINHNDITALNKLYLNTFSVKNEDKLIIKSICDSFGIPALQAVGEAEELCSILCSSGEVDMVYSTDTDNYVHGCSCLVTKMDWYNDEFIVTRLSNILNGLGMTMDQFVELCSLCKNDYSNNIKIPNINPKKRDLSIACGTAYKLLKKHKTISNLPEKYQHYIQNDELYGINVEACKTIFGKIGKTKYTLTESESHEILDSLVIDLEKIKSGENELVKEYELYEHINSIKVACDKLKDTDYFEKDKYETGKLNKILDGVVIESREEEGENIINDQMSSNIDRIYDIMGL